MKNNNKEFRIFLWRITSSHTITYFIVGILSMFLFNYVEIIESGDVSTLMKPLDSLWVMAGPGLQIFRGILFTAVLWPFRSVFLSGKKGWMKLWFLFLGLAILGTTGPAPGSFEGIIYTNLPIVDQIIGLRETVFQTLLFSIFIYYWYKYPRKVWNIISTILFSLIIVMTIGGILSNN